MRRRRHVLQVSTFPFLAVLLCTMGSLLMLLLVIDRRAKIAARNRALVELAKATEDQEKTKADRLAELEKRREAQRSEREALLAEREAKRAELERKHGDVVDQVQNEREKTKALEDKTQGIRHQTLTLQQKLHAEIAALERASQALTDEQKQIQATNQRAASTESTLARMTADLESLEQSLADVKAARKREQQTYSLVPYKGRRGDNRRPLYVECTELGIVFHPDKRLVIDSRTAAYQYREEVEKRLAKQTETIKAAAVKGDQTPYLFVMVRPNGITSYYHFLASLQGMNLDFGYEFIESDWILDFTDEEKAAAHNSWNTADQSSPGSLGPRSSTTQIKTGLGKPIVGLRPGNTLANGSERLDIKGDGAGGNGGPGSANGARAGNSGSSSTPGTGNGTAVRGTGVSQSVSSRTPGTDDGPIFGLGDGSSAPHFGPPPRPGGYLANSGGTANGPATGNRIGSGGSGSEEDPGIPRLQAPSNVSDGTARRNGPPRLGKGPDQQPPSEVGSSESGDNQLSNPKGSGGFASNKGNSARGGTSSRASGNSDGLQNGNSPTGPSEPARPSFTEKGGSSASLTGNGSSTPGGGQQTDANRANPEGQSKDNAPSPSGSSGVTGQPNRLAGKGDPSSTGGQRSREEPGSREDADQSAARDPNVKAGTVGLPRARSGGNSETEEGSSLIPPSPFPGSTRPEKKTSHLPKLTGDRDWFIPVECNAEGVSLPSVRLKIARSELAKDPNKAAALIDGLKAVIDRRQAAVRPGESAFRPQLRFIVQADGLRTYHQVYPILETLKLPMTRQDVAQPDAHAGPVFPVH